MRVQHNIPAMSSYRNYNNNTSAINKNLEKLSSGYKINRAGDNAAGLAISEKMRAQITGLEVAQKNAKDGISLVQTAEGALTEVHSMLNRMVTLAEQSANGTYADELDREQLQKEISSLNEEINRIADSSNFNGLKLLDGSLKSAGGTAKVAFNGITASKSAAVEGIYYTDAAFTVPDDIDGSTAAKSLTEGDTITFNVGLADGKSFSVNLTVANDTSTPPAAKVLKGESGTEYALATAGTFTVAELNSAIVSELNKGDFGKLYTTSVPTAAQNISDPRDAGSTTIDTAVANSFVFTAVDKGTDTPKVMSADAHYVKGGVQDDFAAVTVKQALGGADASYVLDSQSLASSMTLFDGTNYDDAVFSINGHKFLVMEDSRAFGTGTLNGGTGSSPFGGIGSDVTFLRVANSSNTAAFDVTETYTKENAKKIAEVTGLNVTVGTGVDTNGNPLSGIVISGKTVKGGLTLQIGDTADKFNQMNVSIGDIHTSALGIDKIDVSTQAGAAGAMDQIKAAINTVSDIRGGLGALQNRLEHTINNLSVMQENIQDAESTIRDTDVAEEMMKYTKNSILVQSAQAMLAQANQQPQGVLQLLQ